MKELQCELSKVQSELTLFKDVCSIDTKESEALIAEKGIFLECYCY